VLPDFLRSSGSGTGSTQPRGDSLRWPCDTLYPLKLALTSPASSGHSVGIVRLQTRAMEFSSVHRSSCICARPWLQSFRYAVSMSSFFRKWHQDTLHYLQLECPVCLVVCHQRLLSLLEKHRLSFPFIDLYVPVLTPWIHWSEATLQFAENTMFMFVCCVNMCIIHKQSKMSSRCHHLYIDCIILGEGWNLEPPLPLFFLV
jgi:hypothetical protein